MIFITVGTHEQPFDRLLKYVDRYIDETHTKETIICQSGYSTYIPKNYKVEKFLSFERMQELITEARVVITHGGPSSFISALAKNKIPIVIPREKEFGEHVNDHQKVFCRKVCDEKGNILLAENYDQFKKLLKEYTIITKNKDSNFKPHNDIFCKKLDSLIGELK